MNTNGTRHETDSARAVCASLIDEGSHHEQPPLLLASASPRRAHILQTLDVPFRVVKSAFEEPTPSTDDHAQPARFVEQLAEGKARAAEVEEQHALVLSADTIVWHNGEILGKPQNAADAISMLQRLRGQEHRVYTGVCLRSVKDGNIEYSTSYEVTVVRFNDVEGGISDEWVHAYVATGEPLDKAGSYGAQDKGALLVRSIEGDFWNVVGLPLAPLSKLLRDAGVPIEKFWESKQKPEYSR
jgi:septum formation protein